MWRERIESVRESLNEDPRKARKAYTDLKAALKAESKTVKRGSLSEAQLRFYEKPIRDAAVHLIAPTNARPEKVRESLSEAHSDIFLGISKLNKRESSDR
jgi:hypothetical protein